VIAERYGLRPEPWYLGIAFASVGLALAILLVRDTAPFVRIESAAAGVAAQPPSLARSFARGTWRDVHLAGISQAGFVNNLNDGLAWGILPLFFASRGLSLDRIAVLAAAYPLMWGGLQLATGWLSDLAGRKPLIVIGMLVQAAAIAVIGIADEFGVWLLALAGLGFGTAMVYPALLAAAGDRAHPGERATALGVYRFWRDAGAIAGALIAGALADAFGFEPAIQLVAAITAGSGVLAAWMLQEPGRPHRPAEVPA
jgi:MFS family permease